ncbi:MAG TPA: hypothetical protein PKN08_09310, partial [Opitutaceae bacterium]|nr:hypothetical protein [Opitutaceae bacterium]
MSIQSIRMRDGGTKPALRNWQVTGSKRRARADDAASFVPCQQAVTGNVPKKTRVRKGAGLREPTGSGAADLLRRHRSGGDEMEGVPLDLHVDQL